MSSENEIEHTEVTDGIDASSDASLRQQLIEELDNLGKRLKALAPEVKPEVQKPGRMASLGKIVEGFSPTTLIRGFEKLRHTISDDLFDIDTWKGIWYVVNYSLESQADFLRRRMKGEYETDMWGFDQEVFQAFLPLLTFLYQKYWRIKTTGLEHIPAEELALLVCSHSGQIPWDGVMVATAVYLEHPSQRVVRTLYPPWLSALPFISSFLDKLGQAPACEENVASLLDRDQIVTIFPESYANFGKSFRERYKFHPIEANGARSAIEAGAPVIPVAVTGGEEPYSPTQRPVITKLLGKPNFPVSPTWPFFGLLGFIPLPTQWHIDVGEPILPSHFDDIKDRAEQISQLNIRVRSQVEQMIETRLAERCSALFG